MTERFLDELNELRVLVLQEQEGGAFRQVALTDAQYKKITKDMCISLKPDPSLRKGFEMATVHINPDWEIDGDAFLGLATRYTFDEEDAP